MNMSYEEIVKNLDQIAFDVLGFAPDYDRSKSYLEYGAQSLSLMKYQSEIMRVFSVKLKFRELYTNSTTEKMAAYISQKLQGEI